jgi:4-amino-4-deoxy-L-arabinose transferase-like glycosyltransferase
MLFSRKVGLVSALLLAVWPATTDVAAMAWSENLFILLILLSAVLTVKAMDPNLARRWQYLALVGGGLAMGDAALTRYSGLPLIPIGGALILLWNLRSSSWIERLGKGVLWCLVAAIPAVLWLLRNIRTAGAAMQPNRPPDADGPLFHLYFALKTIATDSLELISRITLLPELLHLRLWVSGIVVLLVIGVVLALALRRGGLAKELSEAGKTSLRSPESRFVLGMGLGYWGAMWVARSTSIFDNLNSRMMMPAYPLLVIVAVASFGALAHSLWPEARTSLAAAVTVLCVASIAAVVLPHGITKGGPHLKPDAAPDYVDWVAANTEAGSLIAGNSAWDYNFYLKRPVVAFYDTPDQMSPFNCQRISTILTAIEPEHAYFVLCPEDDEETLDANLMGDRYGLMVADLLADDQSNPAFRPIVHTPDLAAWEILDYSWECN